MPTTLLAGAAALLIVLTWALGRRRPPVLLRSTDAAAVAALNRAQIALVSSPDPPRGADAAIAAGPAPPARGQPQRLGLGPDGIPAPGDARRRAELTVQLHGLLRGGSRQRLQAMATARLWRHPAALPILRRGLRDVDPAVMLEAVRGIERYRGCARRQAALPQLPLPRNVSRTR
ncbi:MAG: hypothetical protein AAFX65_02420 [Cyanobacteria bacterium J06638_7]